MVRTDGRLYDQLRPITVSYDAYGYADASVLLTLGNTKVLCAVSLQTGVPPFLKGSKTGWLKAEYAMLPAATQERTQREACAASRSGRSVEISRLIGRSLRAMLNMAAIGERTIVIDCDVLQADGGTRTACITAASLALVKANERWLVQKLLTQSAITQPVVGVSVGVKDNTPLLDLSFQEDSSVDADFNLVVTKSGSIVELQGTAEGQAVSWSALESVWNVASQGSATLFELFATEQPSAEQNSMRKQRAPLFSLSNRVAS